MVHELSEVSKLSVKRETAVSGPWVASKGEKAAVRVV